LQELIDTVTHENTHNYQSEMLARASEIGVDDEDYQQLLMFAANEGDGYVNSTEAQGNGDYDTYKKQPQERHAFKAGNMIGARVFQKL
jgi:hypothetical protein